MNKHALRSKIILLLLDIRFWLVFFIIIRLIGITNAPLEVGHNWRQSLTNMIARNFSDVGFDFFYPRIDMAGEKTGIIGAEFPLFNTLIYFFNELFGPSHWYGRLINVLVSNLGVFYFYRIIKTIINEKTAFSAAIILSASIWFGFSRKIMPDTFSIALMMIGLYYAIRYLKNAEGLRSLIAFFLLSTLGMLCKIPALSLFSLLGIIVFIPSIPLKKKIIVFATGTLSFVSICIWYFYWVPYLVDTYHFQLYFPKTFSEGIQEILPLLSLAFEKFYFSSLMSYLAFAACLAGLILLFVHKKKWLLLGFGIVFLFFILFIVKTGAVFPLHSYYIIPFTPIMAALAGYAIVQIKAAYRYIFLALIVVEGIANQQHDFFIKENQKYKLTLEEVCNQTLNNNDLVIINGGPSPQMMYFAHRKGWTTANQYINRIAFTDSLYRLGARYLIIDHHNEGFTTDAHQQLFQNEDFSIYTLKSGLAQ